MKSIRLLMNKEKTYSEVLLKEENLNTYLVSHDLISTITDGRIEEIIKEENISYLNE